MGVDPVTLGIGATVAGGVLKYGENVAARGRAAKVSQQAQGLTAGGNADIERIIQGYLTPPNQGQDSFLQYLRANPNGLAPYQYDQSKAFDLLKANDVQTTADQVAGLRSSVGSLGERFGGGFASREAILRSRLGADIATRNAGISQSSFQNALQAGMQGFQYQRSNVAQLLQTLLAARQGGVSNQLQALGLGAAQPYPSIGEGIQQGGIDIAQLQLLAKYLGGGTGGTH